MTLHITTLPITVIGGYLGAGKTTLVNHLLRHADGDRIAVLVNEFGALPIDQDLIEAQDDNIISIAGGCVCCSYGNDLVFALMELGKLSPAPDHVLLEASGVALPGAIAASIGLLDGYRMEGVVVLANAETIRDQADDPYVGDTITRQLADADIVLLNKVDLVPEARLSEISEFLEKQTQGARIVPASQCDVPKDVVLQPFPGKARDTLSRSTHDTSVFTSRFFPLTTMVSAETLASALADASLNLIRAKGFVATPEGDKAIQIAGRRWAVSDAADPPEPGIVVIGLTDQLDPEAVQQVIDMAVPK